MMTYTRHSSLIPGVPATTNVAVGRYVIMPDHVHLFVRGSEVFELGPWVGLLNKL